MNIWKTYHEWGGCDLSKKSDGNTFVQENISRQLGESFAIVSGIIANNDAFLL